MNFFTRWPYITKRITIQSDLLKKKKVVYKKVGVCCYAAPTLKNVLQAKQEMLNVSTKQNIFVDFWFFESKYLEIEKKGSKKYQSIFFQTYDISYLLNSWWEDPRLKHGNKTITFTEPPEGHLWYPNLMLTNSDNSERVGNEMATQVYANGIVFISQR